MRVILKSGTEILVDLTAFTVQQSPVTGDLIELKWTAAEDATSTLNYVRVDDVSAILRIDEPGDEAKP